MCWPIALTLEEVHVEEAWRSCVQRAGPVWLTWESQIGNVAPQETWPWAEHNHTPGWISNSSDYYEAIRLKVKVIISEVTDLGFVHFDEASVDTWPRRYSTDVPQLIGVLRKWACLDLSTTHSCYSNHWMTFVRSHVYIDTNSESVTCKICSMLSMNM